MRFDPASLVRAGLLGLSTGSRSMTGLAAQVVATPELSRRQPERLFGRRPVKAVAVLLATAELVGDKLPATPSRLAPPGLVPRLVVAAGLAVLVARAEDEADRAWREPTAYEAGPAEASQSPEGPPPEVPPSAYVAVPVAVVASLAGAFLGHAWRGWAARRLGRDWPGAVAEDLAAITLAGVATRP